MNKILKNIGALALCLALLLGILWCIPGNVSTAKAAAPNNLLADYDFSFENTAVGDDPADWNGYDSSENHYEVTDEEASHGTHSLKLEIRPTTQYSRGIRTPYLNVAGMKSLYLSVDFKCTYRADFYLYFYDESGAQIGSVTTAFMESNGEWVTFSKTYDVPTTAKTARIMLYKNATKVDTVYFDNVIVRENVYYEINETFESINNEQHLLDLGWMAYSANNAGGFATATDSDRSGKVLTMTQTAATAAAEYKSTGMYTPYITLGSMTKFYVSADGKSSEAGQVYVYFYNAAKQKLANTDKIINLIRDGAWHTVSSEYDVPEGAVYARVMLYAGNSVGPVCFDNVIAGEANQTPTTTAAPTTAPATTAPATTAPATTAPATTAPATTAPATSPDTGDNTALGLMIGLMALSVVALVATKAKFGIR